MDKSLLDEYSRKSIEFIDQNYNAKNNLKELMKIYDSIIKVKEFQKLYL